MLARERTKNFKLGIAGNAFPSHISYCLIDAVPFSLEFKNGEAHDKSNANDSVTDADAAAHAMPATCSPRYNRLAQGTGRSLPCPYRGIAQRGGSTGRRTPAPPNPAVTQMIKDQFRTDHAAPTTKRPCAWPSPQLLPSTNATAADHASAA